MTLATNNNTVSMEEVRNLILVKANIKGDMTDNNILELDSKVCAELALDNGLSINTWKRIFGTLERRNGHKFSKRTLSIVADYLGCDSWEELSNNIDMVRNSLKTASADTSEFVPSDNMRLFIQNMRKGDIIRIEYKPSRMIEAECIDRYTFRVMNSRNSKLMNNDKFKAYDFAKGDPFTVYNVIRNGCNIGNYKSALHHCIESVNISHPKSDIL